MFDPMTDAEVAELLVRRSGRHGTSEVLCLKAHAEIMRMRAVLEEAASDMKMSLQIDVQKDAEIERLRAALEVFACDCAVHERCAVPDNCRNFQARRALAQGGRNE